MRLRPCTLFSPALLSFPLTIANPEPEPAPQFTNNAPFSGAIYIVNPNGQPVVNTAGTENHNLCPAHASVSCNSINQPSWCCPNSYTCAIPASGNGLIGCCPSGSTCSGVVNQASVSTVTVVAVAQPPHPTVTTVVVQDQPPQNPPYQQGFCSTLTANGPGLPTTRQGDCGVILVVNDATVHWGVLSYVSLGVVVTLQLALGRMFRWFW